MIEIREKDGSLLFKVRVITRSPASELAGEHDGALKVRIKSPPVDGEANQELVRLLAKQFGVAGSDVEIVGGLTSRNKRIKISNLSQSTFEQGTK